jgi:hypothetical protein
MSYPYINTWNLVNRKFYTSNKKQVVYKFLINNYNVFNNPFVYQGYILELKPGYYYYPDTGYFDVRIDLDGVIHWSLFRSVEVTPERIVWNSGEVWTLSEVPKDIDRPTNYLNYQYIDNLINKDTTTLYNRINDTYGYGPVVKGEILPTWRK